MSTWDEETVRQLRGAAWRADGSVVELARGRLTDEVLQLAGGGLVDAAIAGVTDAAEVAGECAEALRRRAWDGDSELADQLDAACGRGVTPMLRPLPVDLDDVALALHGDEVIGGARIDRETGDWRPLDKNHEDIIDEAENDDDYDEGRWLYVESIGSHAVYRDLEVFISTVVDLDIADRLRIAIDGKGPFRRFKDVLSRWPEEMKRYLAVRDERQRGRARAWLAEQGYVARRINP